MIVSSDPQRYNFSESTSLSECLIVAKRADEHIEDDETIFVNLLSKPQSALEAITLVDKVKQSLAGNVSFVYGNRGVNVVLNRVKRKELLEQVDNWNRFLAVADVDFSNQILKLIKDQQILLGSHVIPVKLVRFTHLMNSIGVNRRGTIIKAFGLPVEGNRVDCTRLRRKAPGSYPVLCGGGEELRRTLRIVPNAYVPPAAPIANSVIPLMSRLLIPYRIRWNTSRLIAIRSDEPILSNMFFMTQLNVPRDVLTEAEKALAVWLNSVWGVLTILANRQETEGAFTGLNIGNWRLLQVLDVANLDKCTLKRLSYVFDDFQEAEFPRLPEQFSRDSTEVNPNRLGLDLKVLEALDPCLDREKVTEFLLGLYGSIREALLSWIVGTKETNEETG